jgi:hypothetical protein
MPRGYMVVRELPNSPQPKQYYVERIVPGSPLPPEQQTKLTDATRLFAKSFARYDPEPIIPRLADDAEYEGQHVLEPIGGKEAIAEYLRGRYAFLSYPDGPTLELGEVDLPEAANHPCAIRLTGDKPEMLFVIELNAAEQFQRINLLSVAPRPAQARRSGEGITRHA